MCFEPRWRSHRGRLDDVGEPLEAFHVDTRGVVLECAASDGVEERVLTVLVGGSRSIELEVHLGQDHLGLAQEPQPPP